MVITLNEQQQRVHDEAIDWFNNSSEQVFQITGAAGTGKSVLMGKILNSLNLKSTSVMAMTFTGAASLVMRRNGFPDACTIHSGLYHIVEYKPAINEITKDDIDSTTGLIKSRKIFTKKPFIDPEIKLMFIDEAYMVPARMKKDILSFGVKIIVSGDSNQLGPPGDEPAFLVSGKIHRLTQLMRQAETDPIIYLANRVLQNKPIHNGVYGNNVLVIDDTDIIPQMYGIADVIICGTNRTRDLFNSEIRRLAGFSSSILPRVGERIICRHNNWDIVSDEHITLVNGLAGVVINQRESIDDRGKTFTVDFLPDKCNIWFDNIKVNYEYFTSTAQRRKEIKDLNSKYVKGELFEYAYALTCHLSQGQEYNNVFYYEEYLRPQMQAQANYTAITRAKNTLIYVRQKPKYF